MIQFIIFLFGCCFIIIMTAAAFEGVFEQKEKELFDRDVAEDWERKRHENSLVKEAKRIINEH
jgi:hypothetical protein